MENNSVKFSTNSSVGSTVNSIYGKRNMKVYPIYEQEMDTLTWFNSAALVFFSIGSFFLSPLLDFFQKWINNEQVPIGSGAGTLIVIAVAFYIAGSCCLFFKREIVRKIKQQCQ